MSYGNIPMRPPYGFVDDDGVQPENSIRVTPDPLAGMDAPRDPKAAAFMGMRKRNPLTDPSQATGSVDLSDTYDASRGGGPLRAADRVKYTGSGSLNPEQYTDVAQAALVDNANVKQPITATMNGVNYSYTPRIRVNDQKAQVYLQDAQNRRVMDAQKDTEHQARLDKDLARNDMRAQRDIDAQREYFAADNARRVTERQGDRADRRDDLSLEGARLNNKVMTSQADTAAYDASIEGRKEKQRGGLYNKLIDSSNPNARRLAAQGIGSQLDEPGLANAVSGTYEDKVTGAGIRPLVEQYKATLKGGGPTGYGMYRGDADTKRSAAIAALIKQRASDAGLTPDEIKTLEAEMTGGDQGNTIGSALSNLFTLNG